MATELVSSDLRAVIRSAPDSYLLLTPDLRIAEASDAYLASTMAPRETSIGKYVFEVFPDDPQNQGAESNAKAAFLRVTTERQPNARTLRYPLRRRDGGFEERHWRTSNTPVFDDKGEVAWILHRAEDITDRVAIEALSAEASHYIELLDGTPDAIVIVGEDNRIQLVNRQTEAIFGYRRDELMGRSLDLLIPERFRGGHLARVSTFFARPNARAMGSGLRLYGLRKDGKELPIEVSLSPIRDDRGLIVAASIRDISDRTRLEDRLTSAVESFEHAFALFDADDKLISCNATFRQLVHEGVSGSLVGLRYEQILDLWLRAMSFATPEARESFRANRLTSRRTEDTSIFDVRLHDGRSLRIVDRRTPEGGLVKTIVDRTADERLARELDEARAVAEAASAAKSQFLSSMSHELRTPMNAILGFAQLLDRDRKEPLSDRHRERVGQILRGGSHLLRLINDILDLARIEAGGVSISPEPVDVSEVLAEVLRTLEPLALRAGVSISNAEVPPAIPSIRADRTRLVQILMNFGS
ncbi:MAG TPA: PAS domain S-box protein, partial [Kofleriaceae bacterium]